jgi:hypothetical protein
MALILLAPPAWKRLARHFPRHLEMDRDEGEEGLAPKKWQEFFNRGRRTRDHQPAAAHRMKARANAMKMPLARPSGASAKARRPIYGPIPKAGTCD